MKSLLPTGSLVAIRLRNSKISSFSTEETTRPSSVRTSVSSQNWELVYVSFLVVERSWDANLARRRVDLELSVLSESVAHRVVDDGVDSAIRICGRYLYLKKKRRQGEPFCFSVVWHPLSKIYSPQKSSAFLNMEEPYPPPPYYPVIVKVISLLQLWWEWLTSTGYSQWITWRKENYIVTKNKETIHVR